MMHICCYTFHISSITQKIALGRGNSFRIDQSLWVVQLANGRTHDFVPKLMKSPDEPSQRSPCILQRLLLFAVVRCESAGAPCLQEAGDVSLNPSDAHGTLESARITRVKRPA